MPVLREPLLEVPLTIGHEEDQEFTGAPAVGWVTNVYRKGNKLFADVAGIFPDVSKLVRARAYKHISAELYAEDQSPEGIPARGVMLRRVALLGASIPHVKSLADVPEPGDGQDFIEGIEVFDSGIHQGDYYSERDLDAIVANFRKFSQPVRRFNECSRFKAPRVRLTASRRVWQDTSRTWACFSEVTAMAEDAVQQVAEAAIGQQFPGLPPEFIASLTPDQMGMLASTIAPTEETDEATAAGAMPAAGMAEWPPDAPSREAVIAALVSAGQDQAALDAMSDEELIGMYAQKMGGDAMAPFAEDSIVGTSDTVSTPPPAAPRTPTKITTTQQFSEQRLTLLEKRLVAAERSQRQRERLDRLAEASKRRTVVKVFCEQLAKAGKCSPAEVEFDGKTGEPLGALAFALSAASAVRKFSEGGKEKKSDLEVLMEKLEQRPARHFGEQVQDPVQGSGSKQMSQERREHLLKLTSRGRGVLAAEGQQRQTAKMFAETLAGMLSTKLNGRG